MGRILKIATVDDIQEAREDLAERLKVYLNSRWLKYTLFHYESGEAFVDALKRERFDIVFMDIFMGGMTGIEAASQLRVVDMDCKLIFLTISADFLADGYGYNPCHYLLKPYSDAKFEQAMHNCQIKRQLEVPFFDIISKGAPLRIDTTELMYINICERNTTLHMVDHTLTAYGSMIKVIEPLLADERFLRYIQGVLVNMDFIRDVNGSLFLLKSGEHLHMTIRNKNKLIKQYRAYQFQKASDRGGTCLRVKRFISHSDTR